MRTIFGLPRLASILTVLFLTIAGTAALAEFFLTSPPGFFVYVPAAVALNIAGFSLVLWMLRTKHRPGLSARRPLARVVIVVASILAVFTLTVTSEELVPLATSAIIDKLYHSDPIGVGNDVARGPCKTRLVAAAKNMDGLVADVRETYCSGNWDGDLMYFVFAHHAGGQGTRGSLVFRYRADTLPSTKPPTVAWSSRDKLAIAAHWNILDVTYQMLDTKDISIEYDLRSDSRPMFPDLSESIVRQ